MADLKLEQFLEMTKNGKIFSIEFIKRTDGQVRKMTCRRGVTKGITGKGMAYDAPSKNLLGVWDVNVISNDGRGAYRMINLDSLISLRMSGKTYTWNKDEKSFVEGQK